MKTPHIHSQEIHVWADGDEIEYMSEVTDSWVRVPCPSWDAHIKYRIKPGHKPNVVGYTEIRHTYADTQKPNHNTKATFDGGTGKLIKLEVIS